MRVEAGQELAAALEVRATSERESDEIRSYAAQEARLVVDAANSELESAGTLRAEAIQKAIAVRAETQREVAEMLANARREADDMLRRAQIELDAAMELEASVEEARSQH